jgi:DNA-binding NtrC family response regulator
MAALRGEKSELQALPEQPKTGQIGPMFGGTVVGYTPVMRRIYSLLPRIAASDCTLLITGESGTGKEILARDLHMLSPRRVKHFLKVSCGALPDTLLETELFGHEKGAFTDAFRQKPGRFELANGGTILLDEVGEMSPAMQVKVLRVLQEGEFERLGGTQTLRSDVRVAAATHRNLAQLVAEGKFREDLYYRLKVIAVHLPSLAERRQDIPLLCQHFLQRLKQEGQSRVSGFSAEALEILASREWPGNIRELENAVRRLAVLADGEVQPADLDWLELEPDAIAADDGTLEAAERRRLAQTLAACGGNRTRAAAALGIGRRTLQYKLREYDIHPGWRTPAPGTPRGARRRPLPAQGEPDLPEVL